MRSFMQHICVFSRIQGQEMGNEFNYDKVYTASLNANDPNTSQSAVSNQFILFSAFK